MNGLQGHLPELHLGKESVILAYSNYLSCSLPKHGAVQPRFSIALVGNHFAQPTAFPEWIKPVERSPLFCVSNKQAADFVKKFTLLVLLFGGCCLLSLKRTTHCTRDPWTGDRAARRAWHRTIQHQLLFTLTACLLLPLYSTT
eukprot:782287-Amphidinium_carterae.1